MVTIINNVKSKRDDIDSFQSVGETNKGTVRKTSSVTSHTSTSTPKKCTNCSLRDSPVGPSGDLPTPHRQSTVNNCASGDRTVAVTMHIGRTGCGVSCQATTRTNSTTLTVSDAPRRLPNFCCSQRFPSCTHRSTHPVQSTKNSSAFDQTYLRISSNPFIQRCQHTLHTSTLRSCNTRARMETFHLTTTQTTRGTRFLSGQTKQGCKRCP